MRNHWTNWFSEVKNNWPPYWYSCWGPDQKLNVWLLPTLVLNYLLVEQFERLFAITP